MERSSIESKRDSDYTALPRANAYSLFSQLLSSPHDIKSLSLTPEISFDGLPYDFEIKDILDE